jgi:hypothetical protein
MKCTQKIVLMLSLVSPNAMASARSVCEIYAKNADSLPVIRTVEASSAHLTQTELGLIQTTILFLNPGTPLTAAEALAEFRDDQGEGSNAGALTFREITTNGRKHQVASVTYYPGDNQYGLLFEIVGAGAQMRAEVIGRIGDGDISCLRYVEVN